MSHWYLPDGSPFHFVPNASKEGELRPTTLRDVRKKVKDEGIYAVPSVTSIESVIAAPGLTDWKIKQAIALAQGTTLSEAEIFAEMKKTLEARAQQGTDVHNALESYFKGEDVPPYYKTLGGDIRAALTKIVGEVEWEAEKRFYDSRGFGGCADLVSPLAVVDFKTKEGCVKKTKGYDYHGRQLAAYREGLGLHEAQMFNVFISIDIAGEFSIYRHNEDNNYFDQFLAALGLWKSLKNYEVE